MKKHSNLYLFLIAVISAMGGLPFLIRLGL